MSTDTESGVDSPQGNGLSSRECECKRTWYARDDCAGIVTGQASSLSCVCAHCHGRRQAYAKRAGDGWSTGPPDEFVVESILRGDRMPTNRQERLLVTLHATARGDDCPTIARMLGIDRRSVTRYRREIREGS